MRAVTIGLALTLLAKTVLNSVTQASHIQCRGCGRREIRTIVIVRIYETNRTF